LKASTGPSAIDAKFIRGTRLLPTKGWLGLEIGFGAGVKMTGKSIAVLKTHAAAAVIVVGGVIVAVPVFVCLLTGRIVEIAASWIVPRAPLAAHKFRQLAELAEARISGQASERLADLPAAPPGAHSAPWLTNFLRRALAIIPTR